LDFPGLEFILAPVCFDPRGFFRASDFGFFSPGAWRDNIFCHLSLEHKMLETNSQTSERKNPT
jgi:hypothetical protein